MSFEPGPSFGSPLRCLVLISLRREPKAKRAAGDQPSVGRLTDEARSVLMPSGEPNNNVVRKSSDVGRLSQDQVAAIMAGGGGEGDHRKTSDVGRLTHEQVKTMENAKEINCATTNVLQYVQKYI